MSSNFQSWINIAKLFVGSGYLSFPNVFSKTGIIGGIVLFSVCVCLNIYTMMQNIWVSERHPTVRSYSTMGDIMWGRKGKLLVDIPLWIMQIGSCISYLYLISDIIDDLVCTYTGGEDGGGYCDNQNMYIAILTIPALPVSWIKTYTFLSYFSFVSLVIALAGLMMIFGYLT